MITQEINFDIKELFRDVPLTDEQEKIKDSIPVKTLSEKSCPSCGINLETVMMYCCPRTNCPTGLGYNVTC